MTDVHVADRSGPELWVCDLGQIRYPEALEIQSHVATLRRAGTIPDTLLTLEHPPVYTRGRRSSESELPLGEAFYRDQGIDILQTDRGGRLTYHGPGQLVGYPIMATSDVLSHLRGIEVAIIDALAGEAIVARSRREEGPDYTGVWVGDRKIASIGVHLSRGVTTHGFAINVTNDLEPFTWVVPCGLPDVTMTSLAHELGRSPHGGIEAVRELVALRFCEAHGRSPHPVPPSQLGLPPSQSPPSTRDRTSRARELASPLQPRGCDPDQHAPQTVPPRFNRERTIA